MDHGNARTLSQTTDFRLFQTERLCRQQLLTFMKIEESSPEGLENTVGKGEITRYEQFLVFPKCFQKTCTMSLKRLVLCTRKNQGLFGKCIKTLLLEHGPFIFLITL